VIETLENCSKPKLISIIIDAKSLLTEKENLLASSKTEIERLNHQIKLFKKELYGPKKETHESAPAEQTKLAFEMVDLDLPQDIELQKITYHRKKTRKKRTDFSKIELPADLERVVTIIEPADKTGDMVFIREERTELLATTQQKVYVKVIIRRVYGKPNKEGVVIAELPSRVIPGGKVDESFLVMLLLDKYFYHMPLYRQLIKYRSLGIELCDATVGDWTAKTITMLNYLYERLMIRIRGSSYLQGDETTIKVLDKSKKGKTHLGYYWVYRAIEENLVLFSYHPGRDHGIPLEFLQDYKGHLQTDGLAQYEKMQKKLPGVTLVGCMAHARRKFFDAQDNNKEKSVWMLDRAQELYAIEYIAREGKFTHQQRLELRQQKSVPVLKQMKQWLDDQIIINPTTNPFTTAMHYMADRWGKLTLFASDGRLEIDNVCHEWKECRSFQC
jgi:transposase